MHSPGERSFPLAPAQERLWFLHRLDPLDPSYHMFSVLRLRGTLDGAALRRALDGLVERHQPLRTRYAEVDGVPVGLAAPSGSCPLELLDLTAADDPQRAATELIRARLEEPLELTGRAPLRAALLRLGPEEHVLALVLHHIAADGWSTDLFIAELAQLYNAALTGAPDPLPPLRTEYHEWAALRRERADHDREFWQQTLAGAPSLELRADGDTRGAFHRVPLPAALTGRLRALARAERATTFLVLLSAFQVLLARHHDQDDLCVGTPIAGRDRVELESLFGYLSSTLVLRADLSGAPSLRELLRRNRRAFFAAHSHPDVPFEALGSGPAGPFQALFVLNGAGGADRQGGFEGLRVDHFPVGLARTKAAVTLDAWDDPDHGVSLLLGHRLNLLDHAGGARLAEHLGALLTGAVADPDRPVHALAMLSDQESRELIAAGRGEPGGGPAPDPLRLLAERAERTPGAVAILDRGRPLTYGALAEQVAEAVERLREHGVGAETVVAVSLPRGGELIVALLAVLSAGGAYCYLDPADPPARRARAAERAGAALLLDQDGLSALLTERQIKGGTPGLAYICVTSGSTGEPKAVQLTREGLAARVRWMAAHYELAPGDRVLQFASPAFDTHAEEIFPCLAAGATLVLLPGGGELLPDFLRTPEGAALTVLDLPTSYWHALTAEPATPWPPALRLLILGGEQARGGAVAAWRRAVGPRVRLVNTYGPTEATVIATAAEITELADGPGDPPIGRPLADTDAHVLDAYLRPVPPGTPGQLYLGGAGLARGYQGEPGRTAERFPPDPYGPPGARLYATGDRVRRSADGQLHFLGRLDDQLKVRGFRIEPAEVERELTAEPEVAAAAVAVHDQALVGYLVTELADPGVLRARLAARLPERLVPTRFVLLDRLPLTANGKVDRAALPPPAAAAPARPAFLAPRDDAERLVAVVWAEVLGLAEVGAEDDFFALGGHSLHALRVAARLGGATSLDLPVRLLFDHRTVARLAAELTALVLADLDHPTDREAAPAAEGTPLD